MSKQNKYNAIKSWLDTLEDQGQIQTIGNKIGSIDPLSVLSKLTELEMQVVLSMVSAANSLGYQQCREQRRQMLEGRFDRREVYENRAGLKLVNGGFSTSQVTDAAEYGDCPF